MKVQYIENYQLFKEKDLVLALGFFDGMHLGHKKILESTIEISKKMNKKAGILTFNMSVFDYINKNEIENLTSINKKIELVKEMDFDAIYIIELTDDFINMEKNTFINLFLKDMAHIVVGFDYTFGKNREGDTNYLKNELKDKVTIIEKVNDNNEKISTTIIKELLKNGDVINANRLLQREYEIEGYIHKRNKYYSMSVSDLLIPRNGEYLLSLKSENIDIEFTGKIKNKDDDKNVVLKTNEIDFNEFDFKKHEYFTLKFIKNTH